MPKIVDASGGTLYPIINIYNTSGIIGRITGMEYVGAEGNYMFTYSLASSPDSAYTIYMMPM